jgi:hypothetical protein
VPYLVEWVLADRQPGLVAGPEKAAKTSLMLDLGVAVSMGGKWLGHFNVPTAQRVLIMSGESGGNVMGETLERIAAAAGYNPSALSNLLIEERLPHIDVEKGIDELHRLVCDHEIAVLILDPAYLCMSADDVGNLFAVGERLRLLNELTDATGVCVLLVHHMRKLPTDRKVGPELTDVAWASYREWARQWLLVHKREPYNHDTGTHHLLLAAGGSAGHHGQWAIDITEGHRTDPGGRVWQVDVMDTDDADRQAGDRRGLQKPPSKKSGPNAGATSCDGRWPSIRTARRPAC